jgi:hypothetical protein
MFLPLAHENSYVTDLKCTRVKNTAAKPPPQGTALTEINHNTSDPRS